MNAHNTPVFQSEADRLFFEAWIQVHTSLPTTVLPRAEWRNSIRSKGPNNTLTLPEDMKIGELPGLIRRICRTQPYHHNEGVMRETRRTIRATIVLLLSERATTRRPRDIKLYTQALRRYIALYETIAWDSWLTFSEKMLTSRLAIETRYTEDRIRIREDIAIALRAERIELDSQTPKNHSSIPIMPSWVSDSFIGFFETFLFDRAKITLSSLIRTFSVKNYYEYARRYGELPPMHTDLHALDQRTRRLSHAIGIDRYLRDLQQARRLRDREKYLHTELSALSSVTEHISRYPWHPDTPADLGSLPSYILRTLETVCVGRSLLAHVFFETLDIEHETLLIPAHSAIFAHSWRQPYYIDPTNYRHPLHLSGYISKKIGIYDRIEHPILSPDISVFCRTNAHSGIMGQILVNMGNERFRTQQYREAVKFFEGALGHNDYDSYAHSILGRTYFKLWEYEKANLHYERSLALYPDNTDALFALGNLLFALEKYQASIHHYRSCLALQPDDPRIWYNLATVYMSTGSHQKALSAIDHVLRIDPIHTMGRVLRERILKK